MAKLDREGTVIAGAQSGRQAVLDHAKQSTLAAHVALDPAADRDRATELRDKAASEPHVIGKVQMLLAAEDAEKEAAAAETSAICASPASSGG